MNFGVFLCQFIISTFLTPRISCFELQEIAKNERLVINFSAYLWHRRWKVRWYWWWPGCQKEEHICYREKRGLQLLKKYNSLKYNFDFILNSKILTANEQRGWDGSGWVDNHLNIPDIETTIKSNWQFLIRNFLQWDERCGTNGQQYGGWRRCRTFGKFGYKSCGKLCRKN